MAEQAKKPYITIYDLEKSPDMSVWVLNKANPPGNISFSIPDGMGNVIPIRIPITYIPIDLTEQATKQAIISNPNFRKLVSAKFLVLMSHAAALEALESEDAQKEQRRLLQLVNEEPETELPQEIKQVMAATEGNINGFVLSIANTDDVDEDSAMSALRGQAQMLTKEDFQYLLEHMKFQKVKDWAAEQLNNMSR
jgi:hypothetical protein